MSERVVSSLFTTAALAPEERMAVWRDSINVMFDARPPDDLDPARFNARVQSVLLDGVMLARCETSAHKFDRPVSRILADGLDHYMFQLFECGQVEMQVGRRSLSGQCGAIVGFDLGEVLDSVNDDFDVLSIIVPRTRLADRLLAPDSVQGVVIDPTIGAGRLLADYIRTLFAIGASMMQHEAVAAVNALVELLAAACNQVPVSLADPPDWADHALSLRARRIMAEQAGNADLDAGCIAGLLGVSRTRLYTLFRDAGGVMEAMRELRLRRALAQLTAADRQHEQISQIAYRWGFRSVSHFNRAFRDRFGMAPGEVRALGRAHLARRRLAGCPHDLDRRYETWIETLG